MWGNHKTTGRHYRYLNEKGFDCVSFDLLLGSNPGKFKFHPYLKYVYRGIFYLWTKQIRNVLDSVEGDKILFAFSGPSLSSLWAASQRPDVKKVICDGGPFHHVYQNTKNFFYYELGIKAHWFNAVAAYIAKLIWGYKPLTKLHKVLSQWPPNIPILSIRGVDDNIVALDSIRAVFNPHKNLTIEILEIPHGKHLDGMRDFPDQYCEKLLPFIQHQVL